MASSEYQTTETCRPLESIIMDWPDKPQRIAREMVDKYGLPDEAVPSMLIWHNNKPWTRTIVHRDEVPHQFPESHTDLLEQSIRYKVPVSAIDDVARFNGSVHVDRTKGEITVSCDSEPVNILSMNMVDDIVHGRKNVEQAREAYTVEWLRWEADELLPGATSFLFEIPHGDTSDQDHHMSPRGR